jgi:hypothetical protein
MEFFGEFTDCGRKEHDGRKEHNGRKEHDS